MIISFGVPFMLLMCVPLAVCVVCIVADTIIEVRYYRWNKELRKQAKENDDES